MRTQRPHHEFENGSSDFQIFSGFKITTNVIESHLLVSHAAFLWLYY